MATAHRAAVEATATAAGSAQAPSVSPATAGAPARPAVSDRAASLSLGVLGGILGFHVARASVVTLAVFERCVGRPLGLRKVEFSLLMLLLENHAIPPKRLARALAVTAPNLTLLLDRLQQRGLLLREPNPRDGRSQNVVLTPPGEQLAREAAVAAAPMEAELCRRLSRAEQAMLIELLAKLDGT